MKLDNLSLAFLIEELKPILEGAYINKAAGLSRGVLKLKLHTKQGSKDLIICPDRLFITNYSMAAGHGKTNFEVAMKKSLYNRRKS